MSNPNPHIKTFTASDGYELQFRHWTPGTSRPAGYVVGLHGIQSHSGWYEYSSARLCSAGFDVRFLDRRGSGLNAVDRGHADHHERLTGDVVQLINQLRHQRDEQTTTANTNDSPPIILLAVSWGAKIASMIALSRPELVDRLVLLYPGLCPSVSAKWHQLKLLDIATATGKTRRMVRIPLDDPALFTGDPKWQDFIRNDPHAVHEVSVSFLQAGREMDRIIDRSVGDIKCPTWMALAGNDQIIDNARTAKLFQRFGSGERILKEYAGCQHTLEFEPDRDQMFNDLIDWLPSSV